MLVVDDLRPMFGKAFGYDEVKTPNFDKFLDDGLVFRNSYVQVAVCGPSRASVLTGRRPDSTHINAQPPNSWCWAQRGVFMTLPRYFREAGYITAGGGKLFHPDGCNMAPDGAGGNEYMHPAPMWWPPVGNVSNFTHLEGDDPKAWSLPYFPKVDTIVGNDSSCVQFGVEPCPGPGVHDPSSMPMPHTTDEEHPDGRIATWAATTIGDFGRRGTGARGAGQRFFVPSLTNIICANK
eukprot:SAG25_NODE_4560_length_790_cov_0.767004_1_plen_236_part_00